MALVSHWLVIDQMVGFWGDLSIAKSLSWFLEMSIGRKGGGGDPRIILKGLLL
jgi:hypothetical protein